MMGLKRRHKLGALTLLSVLVGALWVSYSAYSQPPGRGGGGGPDAPDQPLVEKYDANDDGYLNAEERKVARAALKTNASGRRRGPRGRRGGGQVSGKPGPKVAVAAAPVHADAPFYDTSVLRTLFLEFESDDWEAELADFKATDVEIPAKLIVDGMTLPNVGVSFRGASSFFRIQPGLKRSFNISIDFLDEDQRLHGYKSLNLLNCNGDPSMMSSILYSHLSRQRIAAPKVNYLKVVVNGESWGLYVSSQQFNKTFVKENFDTTKGARWKVPGSPRVVGGGLSYLGDEIDEYKEKYEIKSKDKESSWKDLINLCRVLDETPDSELEEKLSPILDIDGALWFLAVDVATANSDGYWTRASDYNIYLDPDGKFHILPHDMNEAFQLGGGGGGGGPRGGGRRGGPPGDGPPGGGPGFGPPNGGPPGFGPPGGGDRPERGFGGPGRGRGGPPGGGGPGHGGVDLDPMTTLTERMQLRKVLLSNSKWKRQYLQNVRTVAELMKWENVGPLVKQYRELIKDEVALDTRKLFTTDQFEAKASDEVPGKESTSLRAFLQQRSEFLLNHQMIKSLED